MRKTCKSFLLLIAFLLAGCLPSQALSTETAALVPSITPSPTMRVAPLAEQAFDQYSCDPAMASLPFNTNLTGTLVLDPLDSTLHFLNLEDDERRELGTIEMEYYGISVSPNGKHMAYFQVGESNSLSHMWLVIEGTDRQQEAKIPAKGEWLWGYWLDNDRLVFSPPGNQEQQIAPPVVVVNPFTNQQQALPSNYPGLKPWRGTGGDPYTFFSPPSGAVYDPSLNLVVYIQTTENFDWYAVLWDRKVGKTLTRILDRPHTPAPLWSPNRKAFYLPGFSRVTQDGHAFYDWFSISPKGQVQQLTHFGDFLISTYMGGWQFVFKRSFPRVLDQHWTE